ncbi:xylulokinase [Halioxenophilus aromaticivorans]|uniref:Xylulose kinase n=1 Tax=Halioxenophilus aromaticivorans TaxID=1306992 RepID=A0AAV3UAP1_9ALTE
MSIYLGIDIGTQSVKTLCYDSTTKQACAIASSPLDIISKPDGTREQIAQWWIDALELSLGQIPAEILSQVAAISVSGQQHGFVPLNARGEVLAPVKLWCDTATTEECTEITHNIGSPEQCIQLAGNPILPGYTASKIAWLKNHKPDAYQQLSCILLPHDYLNFYLTGVQSMEAGDASGTGLFDVYTRQWQPEMVKALDNQRDLSECLPAIKSADSVQGYLQESVAKTLRLPAGIPVAIGGGDNMMAAIGTGNVAPGRVTISLGTSGTLFSYSDSPITDPEGSLAGFCSSTGGWLPLICTMNCTSATELMRSFLNASHDDIENALNNVEIGSEGVITLPFFQGERTPNLPDAQGCILGLNAGNFTPQHLLRSTIESVTFGLKAGVNRFEALGLSIKEIRLTGGGAKNGAWRQLVADVFNLPVSVQTLDEGAALGAALQAFWTERNAAGHPLELSSIIDEHLSIDSARCCTPNAEAAEQYNYYYDNYCDHVSAVTPLYTQQKK